VRSEGQRLGGEGRESGEFEEPVLETGADLEVCPTKNRSLRNRGLAVRTVVTVDSPLGQGSKFTRSILVIGIM